MFSRRALQFGKAQQTAMTLHRLRDCNFVDYPWWIVTCLVLQARQAGATLTLSALYTGTPMTALDIPDRLVM